MTQRQKDTLITLTKHFARILSSNDDLINDQSTQGERDDKEEEEEEEDSPKRKRKRGTGQKKPRHPWGVFIRLEDITLPSEVQKYLRKTTDPIKFLADEKPLENKIDQFGGETVADAFVACYKYTLQLETRRSTDQFRWCFTMLMYFDMVRLIRPEGSGKVGPMMLQELEAVLGPILEQLHVNKQQALQRIDKWSLYGAKLSQLCDEFGAGCIFFLGDYLSANLCVSHLIFSLPLQANNISSLSKLYTAKGHYHEEAFAHLRDLHLKEKAIESGAQTLGAGVRRHLNEPFRSAVHAQKKGGAQKKSAI